MGRAPATGSPRARQTDRAEWTRHADRICRRRLGLGVSETAGVVWLGRDAKDRPAQDADHISPARSECSFRSNDARLEEFLGADLSGSAERIAWALSPASVAG